MADHDVIIIGAGDGGPVVAKELAEQGLSILHLEAGPHHEDPEEDFTHSEADMTNVVSGTFRWGRSDRSRGPRVRRMVGSGAPLPTTGGGAVLLGAASLAAGAALRDRRALASSERTD